MRWLFIEESITAMAYCYADRMRVPLADVRRRMRSEGRKAKAFEKFLGKLLKRSG